MGADFYILYSGTVSGYSSSSNKMDTMIRVKDTATHSTLLEVKSPLKFKNERNYNAENLPQDCLIMASKISDRMMIIDNTNFYIHTYAIGMKGKGGNSGLPPHAFVNKPWKFSLGLPRGTKVVIEDGPKGLVYDSATASLVWNAPDSIGIKQVLLSITQPGKDEYYKEFKFMVK